MTRFKIDWGGGDGQSENTPPMSSTESESNQMSMDGIAVLGFGPPKDVHDETMDAPLPQFDSATTSEGITAANCNGDSNMDMAPGHALPVGGAGEPMCTS